MQQMEAVTRGADSILSWHQMAQPFRPQDQSENNEDDHTEQLISDPEDEAHVRVNIGPLIPENEAHSGLPVTDLGFLSIQCKVGVQVGLSGRTNHGISQGVDLTLGQILDPIWRLRLLAVFSIYFHATAGVISLSGDHHRVLATYLIMLLTVGVPIAVASISISLSYWNYFDPRSIRRSDWITRLLVANFIMIFGGRLAFYWAPTHVTGINMQQSY